jgi:hypothetical protein
LPQRVHVIGIFMRPLITTEQARVRMTA